MPRKRKSTDGAVDASPEKKSAPPTRRSSRIAEAADKKPASPVSSPAKQPAKRVSRQKKESQSDEEVAAASDDHSLNESVGSDAGKKGRKNASSDEPSPKRGRKKSPKGKKSPAKKKSDEVAAPSTNSEAPETEDADKKMDAEHADNDEADFVHVSEKDVPAADSDDVKAAVAAQGEDGQLLVGYVQLAKDELPADDSPEVRHAVSKSAPPTTSDSVAPPSEDEVGKAADKVAEPNVADLTNGNGSSHSHHDDDAVENGGGVQKPHAAVAPSESNAAEEKAQE